MTGKVLNQRVDMVGFIKVVSANPNGDPDMNNEPRSFIDGIGYMTDASIKYKIREWIENRFGDQPGFARFIKGDGVPLETKTNEVIQAFLEKEGLTEAELKKCPDCQKLLHKAMCDGYFDIRLFGGVLTTMTKNKWTDGKITGPVQVSYAQSLEPIAPVCVTITCVSVASESEKEQDGKERNMGTKWIVPYAVYRFDVHVSGALAEKAGMTEEDLDILIQAIWNLYDTEGSSSKTGMDVAALYVFRHDSKFGDCKFSQIDQALHAAADFEERTFDVELEEGKLPESVSVTVYK